MLLLGACEVLADPQHVVAADEEVAHHALRHVADEFFSFGEPYVEIVVRGHKLAPVARVVELQRDHNVLVDELAQKRLGIGWIQLWGVSRCCMSCLWGTYIRHGRCRGGCVGV